MKIAVVKILIFLFLFVISDILLGMAFPILMSRAKPSSMRNMYALAVDSKPDVVILGSSRAMHHYDSRIIEDSLGVSCMNFAAMSNGIILMYGRYKLLTRHHTPRLIVYDIHPPFDLSKGDNSKYIPTLRPFVYDNEIRDYICHIDKGERFKLYSHLYRYNGMLPELISVQFKADKQLFNGYSPLYGETKILPPPSIIEENIAIVDTLKLHIFKEMIADCRKRGIKLCFIVSPAYHRNFSKSAAPIIEICRENGISYKFYDEPDMFPMDNSYFHDSSHLNDKGVQQYTRMIIPFLRDNLNQ